MWQVKSSSPRHDGPVVSMCVQASNNTAVCKANEGQPTRCYMQAGKGRSLRNETAKEVLSEGILDLISAGAGWEEVTRAGELARTLRATWQYHP